MNLNTKLNPVQAGVALATVSVALGMGIANAAGWVEAYGKPYGYPLALLAIGCEIIAVLILSASNDRATAPFRFAVVGLCAVWNVYGGHQFLALRERAELEQRAVNDEKRANLSRDVQRASDCIERALIASKSRERNAASRALLVECRNMKTEVQSQLDKLPFLPPAKESDGLAFLALMIAAEIIKIFALYSVTPSSPAANGGGSGVVSISQAAATLARKRHGERQSLRA